MTLTRHQHGAVGVAHYRVGNASHKRPLHPAKPAPAHHYESGSKLFGQRHDLLLWTPVPQVLFRDLRPRSAHLPGLLVKKGTRTSPHPLVNPRIGPSRAGNVHEVQFGTCTLRYTGRHPRCCPGFLGAVGSHEDDRREGVHSPSLSLPNARPCTSLHSIV